MAHNDNRDLIETTEREAAEFEKMLPILKRKLAAIAELNTEEIQNIVSEEIDELNKIHVAEKERSAVLKRMALTQTDLNDPVALSKKIGREWAEEYRKIHAGFRKNYEEVVQKNGIANVILLHSIAFIKQNIRILTENGTRKLVDKKA